MSYHHTSVRLPPPTPQSVAENYCNSKIIEISHKWTINNFSYCKQGIGKFLKSSTFSAGNNDKFKWCLRAHPEGMDEESKDYLSLYLILVSCNKTEVRAKFKLSVLNEREDKNCDMYSPRPYRFVQGQDWGFKNFIHRDFIYDEYYGFLHENKLTLYCQIIVYDTINISSQNNAIQFKVPECHLSDDFGQLFETKKFSDVILSVNGHEFSAHKSILAARSPVFSAILESEGKKINKVEITDMDHEVLREMLHYIYTGKVSNIENISKDLLAAADKYALDRLKVLCEEHICSNLSVGTAADVLILADMHSADQLKVHVIDFIKMHATDVLETTGWRTMVERNPHLVAEVFRAFVTQQIPPIGPP